MTQHADLSRSPARSRAARRTGALGAVLLAGAVLVGSALPPAAATGPTAARTPADTAAAQPLATTSSAAAGSLDVAVTDISHPVSHPGDEVTIRAKVTNTSDATVSDAVAQLTIDYVAITSRTEIDEWTTADLLDPVRGNPIPRTIGDLAPGASKNVSFTYDPGAQTFRGFGARKLAVAAGDATGRLGIARSFLVYDADGLEREPMQVSVLAAVTSPAIDPADPSTAELELAQQAASGQRLDGVLQVAESTKLSLAIDPDTIGVAAKSDDPALIEWSERMTAAAASTTTYTLPSHDPDLAALAHANVRTTGARSFLQAPRRGNWEVPESWRGNLSWPADGVVPDVETVGLGVAAKRGHVVVGSGGLAYEGTGTVTGRADVRTPSGTARAVVADTDLTRAFLAATDLSGADTETSAESSASTAAAATVSTPTEGAQRLLAETAALVTQTPNDPPSLAIVAPRTWTPDAEGATEILNELDAAGWVDVTTIDTLFAQDAPDVARTALSKRTVAKAELGATNVAALERARDAVVTFSSVAVDHSSQIWRPGVTRLIAPLAVAHRADTGLREALVKQTLEASNALTQQSVTVVPRQDVNFITDKGNIPVRVRNTLGVDATVTVVLRPDHPRLTVDARSTEVIPAGQEIDVQVPVRAIGSGDVAVTAQVLTPTGAKISDDSSFQVRVRAGWEELGTWIAAGLVALLFLAGIWRTVRRGRSPYRATSKDVEEATGTAPEAPETTRAATADSVAARAE
ncbi:DUF6049 family protein [Promicromonospora sp. MEB111]|uniref:DUF6049 family protein n=1 Tax=Promicromonospora sp. MEB111 TaxID=3040301 RepID=UPI002550FB08|nr:DUF6049 family protein [Promicromonospora sp. MEB111]